MAIKFIIPVLMLLLCASAHARLRPHTEDQVLVERSEFIVVGHIKKDSIKYVEHAAMYGMGVTWEHTATLVITEVIKGNLEEKEIDIVINFGLSPMVGGVRLTPHSTYNGYRLAAKPAADQIDLVDDEVYGIHPYFSHLESDQLWFLRRQEVGRAINKEKVKEKLGIAEHVDVQMLDLKDYFQCYLKEDAESALRTYVQDKPTLQKRCVSWLDHLAVQRILAIEDVQKRAEQLLPYFLKFQHWWPGGREARDGLVKCGDMVGDLLLKKFNDPAYSERREDIREVWRELNYVVATDKLVEMLKQHDEFFASQNLKGGDWWNTDVTSELTVRRRRIYGEIYHAVKVLNTLDDRRAERALKATAKRWREMKFGNSQIVDECEQALNRWEERDEKVRAQVQDLF